MKSLWYIKLFVQRGVTAANKPCRSASFGRNGPALPLTADERTVLSTMWRNTRVKSQSRNATHPAQNLDKNNAYMVKSTH